MLKNSSTLSGDESQGILKEILDNQKEALNLNGQLVLLNQKMDVLIEKVGEQSAKPKSALEAILGNSQALISIVFIILVAVFPEIVYAYHPVAVSQIQLGTEAPDLMASAPLAVRLDQASL